MARLMLTATITIFKLSETPLRMENSCKPYREPKVQSVDAVSCSWMYCCCYVCVRKWWGFRQYVVLRRLW